MDGVFSCDYLLITALDDEALALHDALRAVGGSGPEPTSTPTSPTSLHWRVQSEFGPLDILTSSLLEMGQDAAGEWTGALLDVFEPRFVGFLGIAGAASDDTPHSAVLLADRVWYHQRAKMMEDRVEYRGPIHVSGRYLLDRLKHVNLTRLAELFPDSPPWTRPLWGTIASGEEVVASRERRDRLRAGCRDLIGIEMEGHSFADRAEKALGSERWFMVRAVQDRADEHKTDEFRQLACNRAAQFTVGFLLGCNLVLRNGRDDRRPPVALHVSTSSVSTSPGWATELAQVMDEQAAQHPKRYRGGSSGAVERQLAKLRDLIDFGSLRTDEIDILTVALHVAALTELGMVQDEALALIRRAHDPFGEMERALEWTLKASAPGQSLEPVDLAISEVRCQLLAGLLRLSRAMASERSQVAMNNGRITPPSEEADLEDWAAYFTDEIRVRRRGILEARVILPEHQRSLQHTLGRYVALRLECVRRSIEAALAANGIAVGRAPTRWAPCQEICEIPTTVVQRLASEADRMAETIPPLPHLGTAVPSIPTIEWLLPLPESALASPVLVPATPGFDYVLTLRRLNISEGQSVSEIHGPANDLSSLIIDPVALGPGARYAWDLARDDGDFLVPVAWGAVRTLTPSRRDAWEARSIYGVMSAFDAAQYGLWNDALQAVWPRIVTDGSSTDDLLLASDALRAAYEWVYRNAPDSSQVVVYRNAANWVHSKLLLNGERT